MKLDEEFKADEMPEGESFAPIPPAWYNCRITGAEIKKTKAQTGKYIALRLDVVGPSHSGRVLFSNVTISNPNDDAQRIGRQQLGDIMRGIGLPSLTDTDQLINQGIACNVVIKRDPQYGEQNEIKGYRAIDGAALPKPSPASPAAPTQAPASGNEPPWNRS